MKAARFHQPGHPLVLEEIPTPQPGPGEVLVQVKACGVCGSDIHIAVEGITPTPYQPITLGHEPSGVVAELGPGVEDVAVGQRVAVCPFLLCNQCPSCLRGQQEICLNRRCIGIQAEGALARYLVVPAANLIPLPDNVPFEQGAIVTDAVATPFHALTATGRVQAGEAVAIFGCGGLGVHGVQIARLAGAAMVIAVDVREKPLERAVALGADVAIDASQEDPVAAIQRATGGYGADLSLELVGHNDSIAQAVACLRPGGRAVVAGLGAADITVEPPITFVRRQVSLLGSYAFTASEIRTLVGLVAGGRLNLSASVSLTLPLDEVNQGLDMLHHKVGDPVRIVIRCDQ